MSLEEDVQRLKKCVRALTWVLTRQGALRHCRCGRLAAYVIPEKNPSYLWLNFRCDTCQVQELMKGVETRELDDAKFLREIQKMLDEKDAE